MPELISEIQRFQQWAEAYPVDRCSGEWECDYESWTALYNAIFDHVATRSWETWSSEELGAVLYALARDNEIGHLAQDIRVNHPELLVPLTRAALRAGEPDAHWQLAEELGQLSRSGGAEEPLLLILAQDPAEYVRRRALGALAGRVWTR